MLDFAELRDELALAKTEFPTQPEAAIQRASVAITAASKAQPKAELQKAYGKIRESQEKTGAVSKEDAAQLLKDLAAATQDPAFNELKAAYREYYAMVGQLLGTSLKQAGTPAGAGHPGMAAARGPVDDFSKARLTLVAALATQYTKGFEHAASTIDPALAYFAEKDGPFGKYTLESVQLKAYWLRGAGKHDDLTELFDKTYSADGAEHLTTSNSGVAVGAAVAWHAFVHRRDFRKARAVAGRVLPRIKTLAARKEAPLVAQLRYAETLIAESYMTAREITSHEAQQHRMTTLTTAEKLLEDQHAAAVTASGRRSHTARVFAGHLKLVRMMLGQPINEFVWVGVKNYLCEEFAPTEQSLTEPALRTEPVPS